MSSTMPTIASNDHFSTESDSDSSFDSVLNYVPFGHNSTVGKKAAPKKPEPKKPNPTVGSGSSFPHRRAELGFVPHHKEDACSMDVYGDESNVYLYTKYRCSQCLRYHHPVSFEGQDVDDDNFDLCCSGCAGAQAAKEWKRDWHRVSQENDDKKMVYSRITGLKHPAVKRQDFFECAECGLEKQKGKFNYAEVERALEKRQQPTCAACLPDVPASIHKLKAAEIKLYLDGWGCSPVKKGTTKKQLQKMFQRACKKRLVHGLFVAPQKREKGLKDPCKPRSLKLS